MDVGKRAAYLDQSVLLLGRLDSVCVTDIQHVNSAIFFPLMFNLRQVANFNCFEIQGLELFVAGYQVVGCLVTLPQKLTM